MQQSDFINFAESWEQACEGCGKPASSRQIEWAFECLTDKQLDDVKRALIKHARDPDAGQYQPKPADIIRHIEGGKADRKVMAEAAWHTVISNVNRYNSAVFDDPAIHYAIMIGFGSWLNVCDFDKDKFDCQQMYRSFINAYVSYNGQPHPPRMIGIYELESAKGPTKYEIEYHGDKQKALAVEQGGRTGGMNKICSAEPYVVLNHDQKAIGER